VCAAVCRRALWIELVPFAPEYRKFPELCSKRTYLAFGWRPALRFWLRALCLRIKAAYDATNEWIMFSRYAASDGLISERRRLDWHSAPRVEFLGSRRSYTPDSVRRNQEIPPLCAQSVEPPRLCVAGLTWFCLSIVSQPFPPET
jgi:hypothetical protein